MDYINAIKAAGFGSNPAYPQNDIGIAQLFFDLHSDIIRYVSECKAWFTYDGRRWTKTNGVFKAAELCKAFTRAFGEYAAMFCTDDKDFVKYAGKLTAYHKREAILKDAQSIAPITLSAFDRNRLLFNTQNGTLNLKTFTFQSHNAADLITKMANAAYNPKVTVERWNTFIDEVTCGDKALAAYLQKSLGYCLTGLTDFDSFFILYGATTRNGKSTIMEAITNLLDDYACTVQPQTLARRSADGAAASPDLARLKGARLVNVPEPEKDMPLNSALLKQMTGGDKMTVRPMYEAPIEILTEFKPFIHTNHLPRVTDDTIFTSGRMKIIPFNRHFAPHEQDKTLKQFFKRREVKSAILNWLVEGCRLLFEVGFDEPDCVRFAVADYQAEADVIGNFLCECTAECDKAFLRTVDLYGAYSRWAHDNGYKPLNNRNFVAEIRKRCEIRHDGRYGNIVVGREIAAA